MVEMKRTAPVITRAERVYLWRRRRGLRQEEAARAVGVKVDEWQEWETRGEAVPPRDVATGLGKIEKWELMTLWRRRCRWSIRDAAERMGISHVTLIARERGEGDWEETYNWWLTEYGE